MQTTNETTGDWRPGMYKKYSTHFQTKLDEAAYRGFVPYGSYLMHSFLPRDHLIRIVDLGCGIGGFMRVFYEAGYTNIEGIDLSEESVTTAHAHGMTQVLQGDVFQYLENALEHSADVVICMDILEHFRREEALRFLALIHRVLKPGGRVLIHVPNAEGVFGSRIRYADYTHEMAYTQKSIAQVLTFSGFASISSYEDKPLLHNITAIVRRGLWEIMTLPIRFLHLVETGSWKVRLSQNILAVAFKSV